MPQHRKGEGRTLPWLARWKTTGGHDRSKAFRTRREAEDWERRMRIAAADGTLYDDHRRRTPTADWCRTVFARKQHLADTTKKRYDGVINRQIADTELGDIPIGALRPSDVEDWALELTHVVGLAPRTVAKALLVLSQAMKAAVRDGILASNPCEHVKPPKVTAAEMLWLTMDQVEQLAEAIDARARVPWRGDVVLFLAYTGLRWGEMCRLTVADVDLRASRVRVALEAKSEAGLRSVPIATRIVPVLREWTAGKRPDERVFTTPAGGVPHNSNFRRSLRSAVRRSLPEEVHGFRIHDLRHSCATWLINNGAREVEVARWLGHASPVVTLTVYAHLMPDRLDAAAVALDRAAGERRGGMRLVEEA